MNTTGESTNEAVGGSPNGALQPADLAAANNRRGHARLPFGVRVAVHELDDVGVPGEATVCEGHDISRSGVGLRSRKMFYEGRKVILSLTIPSMQPKYMCGVVKYSRYTYRGLYHVGIQLCALPQTESVRAWMQSHQNRAA